MENKKVCQDGQDGQDNKYIVRVLHRWYLLLIICYILHDLILYDLAQLQYSGWFKLQTASLVAHTITGTLIIMDRITTVMTMVQANTTMIAVTPVILPQEVIPAGVFF